LTWTLKKRKKKGQEGHPGSRAKGIGENTKSDFFGRGRTRSGQAKRICVNNKADRGGGRNGVGESSNERAVSYYVSRAV